MAKRGKESKNKEGEFNPIRKPFKKKHITRERSNHAYNPFEIKKQKEFYKNAKKVQKYKKIIQHVGQEGRSQALSSLSYNHTTETDGESLMDDRQVHDNDKKYNGNSAGDKNWKQKTKTNTLQKLRQDYEKEHQEKEHIRKEREAELAVKHETQKKAKVKRKDANVKMFKKTKSGQPVMKFRVQQILERLQND